PATFGFKVAVWIDELCRHVERLRACEARVFVAMLGGGAGTLASLGELGLATQEKMAVRLGMRPMSLPARTIGDHQAEYVTLLGLLAATAGKTGREIYTLMKQEFGEVEEPVPAGTVGSSTMPQKRNPKLSQDITAAAAQIRALGPLPPVRRARSRDGPQGRGDHRSPSLLGDPPRRLFLSRLRRVASASDPARSGRCGAGSFRRPPAAASTRADRRSSGDSSRTPAGRDSRCRPPDARRRTPSRRRGARPASRGRRCRSRSGAR